MCERDTYRDETETETEKKTVRERERNDKEYVAREWKQNIDAKCSRFYFSLRLM